MSDTFLSHVSLETEPHKKPDHSVCRFGARVLRKRCLVTSIQEGLWVIFVVERGLWVSPELLGSWGNYPKCVFQLSWWLLPFDSNSILRLLEVSLSSSVSLGHCWPLMYFFHTSTFIYFLLILYFSSQRIIINHQSNIDTGYAIKV